MRKERREKRDTVLVLFTRFPQSGEVKTRLIPSLGTEGAAEMQRDMTEHVLEQAPPDSIPVEIRYTGGDDAKMRSWLGARWSYMHQGNGDLGERMSRACVNHFKQGRKRVVLIGADCPETHAGVTSNAFEALRSHDVVIGPAEDGGYYLIGVHARLGNSGVEKLFANTPWGTNKVCTTTQDRAQEMGLRVKLLDVMRDVDEASDLEVWEAAQKRARISVIIPTLNEEAHIDPVLSRVLEASNVEVIIADGASSDATVKIAEELGAQVLNSARGRSAQMNAGAAKASGEILLFLHGDTLLPKYWSSHLRRVILGQEGVILGAFRFGLDATGWRYRYLEWTTGIRCKIFSMPYGDQGLFLKRETFEKCGGFPDLPVMEDYVLVRSLKRSGRVITLSIPVKTSARRWQEHGIINVTARHIFAFFAYPLGVNINTIARWLGRA